MTRKVSNVEKATRIAVATQRAVKALEDSIGLDVGRITKLSIKISGHEAFMTITRVTGEGTEVSFCGAETLDKLFRKAAAQVKRGELTWRVDRYNNHNVDNDYTDW